MRRRRQDNEETSDHDEADGDDSNGSDEAEYIDQDDQTKLVVELEQGIFKQQQRMQATFRVLCHITAAVSFLLIIMDDFAYPAPGLSRRALRYIHGLVCVITQQTTVQFVGSSDSTTTAICSGSFIVRILVPLAINSLLTLIIYRQHTKKEEESLATTDSHWVHAGMFAANLITICGSLLLRWDRKDTSRMLSELHGAKYPYKAL